MARITSKPLANVQNQQLALSLHASTLCYQPFRGSRSWNTKRLQLTLLQACSPTRLCCNNCPAMLTPSGTPFGQLLSARHHIYVPGLGDLQAIVLQYSHNHPCRGTSCQTKTLHQVRHHTPAQLPRVCPKPYCKS